jgi:uncharacterized membrane protein YgdD (TMEM256/DUF423 family)
MKNKILLWGAFFGMTAVVLGAFGAHTLKKTLSTYDLQVFETAVRYQMYHALFLLFLENYTVILPKAKQHILNSTIIGVLLFSGSLYILTVASLWQFNVKAIGILTPIGGLFLISSWLLLIYHNLKKQ